MNQTVTISTRVDKDVREEANKVITALGFDISTVMRALLVQIAKNKAVPLQTELSPYNNKFVKKVEKAEEEYRANKGKSFPLQKMLSEKYLEMTVLLEPYFTNEFIKDLKSLKRLTKVQLTKCMN